MSLKYSSTIIQKKCMMILLCETSSVAYRWGGYLSASRSFDSALKPLQRKNGFCSCGVAHWISRTAAPDCRSQSNTAKRCWIKLATEKQLVDGSFLQFVFVPVTQYFSCCDWMQECHKHGWHSFNQTSNILGAAIENCRFSASPRIIGVTSRSRISRRQSSSIIRAASTNRFSVDGSRSRKYASRLLCAASGCESSDWNTWKCLWR